MARKIERYDSELDNVYASCPNCGSDDVVVELRDGYFCVIKCNKCTYDLQGGGLG